MDIKNMQEAISTIMLTGLSSKGLRGSNMLTEDAQKTFDALKHIPINIDDIVDVEIENAGGNDNADAFIASATWDSNGKLLTDDELDQLCEENPEFVLETIMEQ
jgi:hypothetical protein